MNGAQVCRLEDGRLHLQHGPIDLLVELFGADDEVEAGYVRASAVFDGILPELVCELGVLRQSLRQSPPPARGAIAQNMIRACWPHRDLYVTPMAAVAGAVADCVMGAAWSEEGLAKGYVNNGGDIAFALRPGESFEAGIVDRVDRPRVDATVRIDAAQRPRGMATSGWRGRSQSLGIADAVTVLAETAAQADVAATLIANAVNVDDPAIERLPARELDPDSDLGDIPVTVQVGPLSDEAVDTAMSAGLQQAREMLQRGRISAAYISICGRTSAVGAGAGAAGAQQINED